MKTKTIYVRLLDEGTDVWRPVIAQQLDSDVFLITGENSTPNDERWEFNFGQTVRCEQRATVEGEPFLAACGLSGN